MQDTKCGWLSTVSAEILGVIVGGFLAIISGLVVTLMTERRSRGEWRRQAQLAAASTAIRALAGLNREIASLAISDELSIDGTSANWAAFHAASIEWNAARHEAALIAPQAELDALARLDREFDRVLERAIEKQWEPSQFRGERAVLGQLATAYVNLVRSTANEGEQNLPSIWSWASDMDEATRAPNTTTERGPTP